MNNETPQEIATRKNLAEKRRNHPEICKILEDYDIRLSAFQVESDQEFNGGDCGTFSAVVTVGNASPHHATYSMGSGHKVYVEGTGSPKVYPIPWAGDVLHSLLSDAGLYSESRDIDDFAANYCEGMKFSKVLKTWEECKRVADWLETAFTPEQLEEIREAFQDY